MINKTHIDRLREIAQHLDISPTDFELARQRYRAVAEWLNKGIYESGYAPEIYLQGSFRLGTVVRPYTAGADGEFDIDQVFELSNRYSTATANSLKHDVGSRLKENSDYNRMLDPEGKRCWTLIYASQKNSPGFHLDVLPSLKSIDGIEGEIDITNKSVDDYEWARSNPKGYYAWFRSKNPFSEEFVREQKALIHEGYRELYDEVENVPKRLLRSPLQRAVQIMKRHRDVYFSDRDWKPISIIITTISAHCYREGNIFETIQEFTRYVMRRHFEILKAGQSNLDGILDYQQRKWEVLNPAENGHRSHGVENFADKWNLNEELPASFFEWVYKLSRDLRAFGTSGVSDDLSLRVKRFGEGEKFSTLRGRSVSENLDTNELLDLIHLGIEGNADWENVKEYAEKIVRNTKSGELNDVARVNFYQITRHRGRRFSDAARKDILRIQRNYPNNPNFKLCTNLLLGREDSQLVADYLREGASMDVLSWPILRLATKAMLLP